jgi:hypothetical protein
MEIDAGVNVLPSRSGKTAWRLDNPNLKNIVSTQEQDSQGRNLYEFLDRSGADRLWCPGVDDACNDRRSAGHRLPDAQLAVGRYRRVRPRRQASRRGPLGRSLTSSKAPARTRSSGAATDVVETAASIFSQYSGSNDADFYDNACGRAAGWRRVLLRPASNGPVLDIDTSNRVNNHRFIRVDTDNPDNRTSIGYGRVREEQGELRAIARSARRRRARDAYDETALDPQLRGVPAGQVGDLVQPVRQRRRALGAPGHARHPRRSRRS